MGGAVVRAQCGDALEQRPASRIEEFAHQLVIRRVLNPIGLDEDPLGSGLVLGHDVQARQWGPSRLGEVVPVVRQPAHDVADRGADEHDLGRLCELQIRARSSAIAVRHRETRRATALVVEWEVRNGSVIECAECQQTDRGAQQQLHGAVSTAFIRCVIPCVIKTGSR